jgi:hypothetical protein
MFAMAGNGDIQQMYGMLAQSQAGLSPNQRASSCYCKSLYSQAR